MSKNRAIKFRAWYGDKYLSPWPEAFWILGEITVFDMLKQVPSVWNYNDIIVEQFTGLTDKNGKEIFEGDIIKLPRGNVVVVRWGSGTCPGFSGIPVDSNDEGSYAIGFTVHGKLGEIIGNCHENPELLEPDNDRKAMGHDVS